MGPISKKGVFMLTIAQIALLYLPMNISYRWGGKTVENGLDCSGFVSEVLKAHGTIASKTLLNAQGLYDHLEPVSVGSGVYEDAILFFGKDIESITHISIAINNAQMIESGGEGRAETDAGGVRIRPIFSRKDLVAAINL